ncbi:MAG: alpha/beta fold hydrolase, partial [Methylocystaceae bacterium]|nr:alpha/beta fold hydrolase [Methylocystaceae bacterium]
MLREAKIWLEIDFEERAPWIGADLQTLRNFFLPQPKILTPSTSIKLPMSDGDTLVASLNAPNEPPRRPLIILVHGLTGSENSANIISAANYLVEKSWRVLRLNLRGATPTRPQARGHYHAGKTEDLREALNQLPPSLIEHGVLLIGHSLGGNLILKFLGEGLGDEKIIGGVAISSPLKLRDACNKMMKRRNFFYHRHILKAMKEEALAPGASLSPAETRAIVSAQTIYDFDHNFIAPLFGYRDADDYYFNNSSGRFLEGIKKPTLIIHALDDPWIPPQAYLETQWDLYPIIETKITKSGGHLGLNV